MNFFESEGERKQRLHNEGQIQASKDSWLEREFVCLRSIGMSQKDYDAFEKGYENACQNPPKEKNYRGERSCRAEVDEGELEELIGDKDEDLLSSDSEDEDYHPYKREIKEPEAEPKVLRTLYSDENGSASLLDNGKVRSRNISYSGGGSTTMEVTMSKENWEMYGKVVDKLGGNGPKNRMAKKLTKLGVDPEIAMPILEELRENLRNLE